MRADHRILRTRTGSDRRGAEFCHPPINDRRHIRQNKPGQHPDRALPVDRPDVERYLAGGNRHRAAYRPAKRVGPASGCIAAIAAPGAMDQRP